MSKWTSCAALAAIMALGLATNGHAAVATFTFSDESVIPTPANNARGTLVLDDYVPLGGTFVSWKYFRGAFLVYEVNAADLVPFGFSSNLDSLAVGSSEQEHDVRIETATSFFETGIDDPNGGVASLWNLSLFPVCPEPDVPCGGGDGPQIDNGPPFNYTWRLESLVERVAVPEPVTWVLMIGGFGAVGAQLRARRRRVA